jgi:subtilisin family serine protease
VKALKKLYIFLFVLFLNSISILQPYVTYRAKNLLKKSNQNDNLRVILQLKTNYSIDDLANFFEKNNLNRKERIKILFQYFEENKKNYQEFLNTIPTENIKDIQNLWFINSVVIEGQKNTLDKIIQNKKIDFVDIDATLISDKPESVKQITNIETTATVPDNLKVVNANKLWQMGITGKGRLVLSVDTGVDVNHPALKQKWRGNKVPYSQAWYDPDFSSTFSDCDNHGTATTGVMVGCDPNSGDTIGVAIDAEWIAAKALCGNSALTSIVLNVFQWALNPDNDLNTDNDVPDVINCSFLDPDVTNECESVYISAFKTLEAADIAVIFSAGNSGPNSSTITKPKNINYDLVNSFCVGSIDHSKFLANDYNPIASFSSRGPSVCGGVDGISIKPEVVAPGVNIKTAKIGGGYSLNSGTSFAAPHVAGAIALLKQAFPNYSARKIKFAIYNTALDLGLTGEDNTYGKGLIDIYKAYQYLTNNDTIPPDKITNIWADEITSNSVKIYWNTPLENTSFGISNYDIRISQIPITEQNFNLAKKIDYNKYVQISTTLNSILINELTPNTKYYIAIKSSDVYDNISAINNEFSFQTLDYPKISLNKDSIVVSMQPSQQTLYDTLIIKNISSKNSTLNYTATFEGNSSYFKIKKIKTTTNSNYYSYKDNSNNFTWMDISYTGIKINNWQAINNSKNSFDDGQYGPIILPFSFNFFGIENSAIYLSTNGIIKFAPFIDIYASNSQIPNIQEPNGFIAVFWKDLIIDDSSSVFYQFFDDKIIIQYNNIANKSATEYGRYTFQTILYIDGNIDFKYLKISGKSDDITIGIENFSGNDGIQIIYNTPYLKDSTYFMIKKIPEWFIPKTYDGMLCSGNSDALQIIFNNDNLYSGVYQTKLKIISNDVTNPKIYIPITLYFNVLSANSQTKNYKFSLSEVYPNPFNPVTNIKFSVAKNSDVKIYIYDITGKVIKEVINKNLQAGEYILNVDLGNFPSGVYICKMYSSSNGEINYTNSKKMLLIK